MKSAMKWHPDKNPKDKNEAETKCKQISEAYEATALRNAEDIFAEFFGNNPFGFESSRTDGSGRFHSDGGKLGGFNSFEYRKPPPVESKLPCSHEELYTGSTRKMKISRTVVSASGYECASPNMN
ncbi:hypothetical protein V6N12_049908 [Hibiscus sabdariffa]|uniref:J domain-containing protein n=1 Tax=Hibiscus sabdariffa TaxID=183260 RepID=A0ABR2GB25_9ROSI